MRAIGGKLQFSAALGRRPRTVHAAGPSVDLLSGLVAYWTLADLTDASGNGYTLTGVNTPTFGAGKVGNGMFLAKASSQYVKIANASAGLLKAGSASFPNGFTIAGWAYVDSFWAGFSFGANCFAASNDCLYGDNRGWMFANGIADQFNGDTKLSFKAGATFQVNSTSDLIENAWNCVAFRWNGGTGELFVNSVTPEAAGTISWAAETTSDFNLGSASNDAAGGYVLHDGALDEFGIWQKALTNDEIAAVFNGGSGTTHPFT